MKLSEAIRLGAMLRPQAFGTLFDLKSGTSCALGAACEAIGILDTTQRNAYTVDARAKARAAGWMWARADSLCPLCDSAWLPTTNHNHDVQGVIVHLNNDHHWTREQIADWVEVVEAAQDSAQPASVAAVARVDHDQLVLTPRA